MISTREHEKTEKDIGDVYVSNYSFTGTLESKKEKVREEIQRILGRKILTIRRMDGHPYWIVQRTLQEEHDGNWADAYTAMEENKIPMN